jgi:hypothetical protein
MKGKDKGEFVIPIILIVLSIILYANTYTFKFTTYHQASPQMWPRGILVLLVLGSFILIGKLLFQKSEEGVAEGEEKPKVKWTMMLGGILILFLYIFFMKYLGYIVSTLVFALCAMLMLGNRNKVQLFVVPIVLTVFVFFVFTYAMYIPLPKGTGIFRAFSLIFQ